MIKNITKIIFICLTTISLSAQTIAEKKESFSKKEDEADLHLLEQLQYVNQELDEKRFTLQQLYNQALQLYNSGVRKDDSYQLILSKIKQLKEDIARSQHIWKLEASSYLPKNEYDLWHQPETSIQQLVIDYGAADCIYFIPPEICGIRISLNSNLPIPRESWKECLELVLSQYGIGIRDLNPYLRELYFTRNDPSGIKAITSNSADLNLYPQRSRICFMLTPNSTDPRSDLIFLQKFSNPMITKVELISGKIFITSSVENVQELLKLYEFAKAENRGQDFQLVLLSKINASEMESILNSAFHNCYMSTIGEGSSLHVISLHNIHQALFLTGSSEDIKKAQKLIQDLESQIEDPREKTVFWYTTKHSEAEELATVLAKVYDLLSGSSANSISSSKASTKDGKSDLSLVVPATIVAPEKKDGGTSHKTADGRNNFVVDPKTGAIIMVVEQESLPKIKELLKKLDVPKKMVQIEVLLLEKKITNSNKFGINLLRLYDGAKNICSESIKWVAGGPGNGILEFLISRNKGSGIPAYDLTYQFMLGQEDVQINASPSITTINQTPATIAIVEEMSINTGSDDKKKEAFNRAQYGITMQITPTINIDEDNANGNFITLDTNITFDTTKNNSNNRPDVTRRHIKNHVRIADGQTVILGGLRRKNSQDSKDSLPFLGELPGIGKLFSSTEMQDNSTEMFVFITPKILSDPIADAERIKQEELKKRPGDVPEFLYELAEAQRQEKHILFERSLTALFGRMNHSTSNNIKKSEEYDGR